MTPSLLSLCYKQMLKMLEIQTLQLFSRNYGSSKFQRNANSSSGQPHTMKFSRWKRFKGDWKIFVSTQTSAYFVRKAMKQPTTYSSSVHTAETFGTRPKIN